MRRRIAVGAGLCLFLAAVILVIAPRNERADISNAYTACHSEGENFSLLETSLVNHGVTFSSSTGGVVQVGYNRLWSTTWLCALTVGANGSVVGVQRFGEHVR